MRILKLILMGSALLSAAAAAAAHPGHGADGGSFRAIHYMTEPVHTIPIALLIVGGVSAAVAGIRGSRARRRFS